jgi:hypothetical protein
MPGPASALATPGKFSKAFRIKCHIGTSGATGLKVQVKMFVLWMISGNKVISGL